MRSEEGQALVELAFVLPIIAFLLLGLAVLALTINAKLVVAGAARDGARAAAVSFWQGGYEQLSRKKIGEAIDGGGLKRRDGRRQLFDEQDPAYVTILPMIDGGEQFVKVRVRYDQPSLLPFLPRLINPKGAPLDEYLVLVAEAQFRVEPKADRRLAAP